MTLSHYMARLKALGATAEIMAIFIEAVEEASPKKKPKQLGLQIVGGKTKYPEQFETFWKAYPTTPNMSKKEAVEVWVKISDQERDEAVRAIPKYIAHLKEKKNEHLSAVHACRFLSKRRAEGFLVGSEAVSAQTADLVFVRQDSALWGPCESFYMAAKNGRKPPVVDGGWRFPKEAIPVEMQNTA